MGLTIKSGEWDNFFHVEMWKLEIKWIPLLQPNIYQISQYPLHIYDFHNSQLHLIAQNSWSFKQLLENPRHRKPGYRCTETSEGDFKKGVGAPLHTMRLLVWSLCIPNGYWWLQIIKTTHEFRPWRFTCYLLICLFLICFFFISENNQCANGENRSRTAEKLWMSYNICTIPANCYKR